MPAIAEEPARDDAAELIIRATAALAMFGAPPAVLTDTGLRGVLTPLAPVLIETAGGTRLDVVSRRREGIDGSRGMEPSCWRSRILVSRRLMWRSSCRYVNKDHILSSCIR